MVYDTQNYWVCGLCPSSGMLNTRKTVVQRLVMFPSSGEGKETLFGVPWKELTPNTDNSD
jgi:hypothetical protein